MIAHICRLSLRHKASIQANSYRLPYAQRSYGSLTYLRQKLRRCLQLSLPRKKRLLQLCPVTGTADDITLGLRSDISPQPTGAFYCSKKTLNGGASGGDLWRMDRFQFAARWSSAIYGTSSGVSVSAAYSLIIIKA